ncbi:MAG: YhdH/YhfP family quinone oxidoreductase [Cellvibrionaceae bacterium]
MSDNFFQALRVEATANNQFELSVIKRSVDDLPAGDLLVDVQYSSLNYKDALSASGNPGVTKEYPHTPGIDAAGIVLEDSSGTFQAGDEVVVCGYDLGMNTSGGLSQRIRVPANWAVKLPSTLSMKESMIIGTAGFTAALCVDKILHMGANPEDGPVLVSGATGGVGSFSVALLAHLGFDVTALTGKLEQSEWLVSLGAKQVIERSTMSEVTKRPAVKPQWAHAIDCVGGEILSNILKSLQYGGSVAICGMTASPNFNASVFPFILRNVNLLGVDCVEQPLARKRDNWNALSAKYKLPNLETMAESIKLEQAPEYLARILNGHARGRYLVDLSD